MAGDQSHTGLMAVMTQLLPSYQGRHDQLSVGRPGVDEFPASRPWPHHGHHDSSLGGVAQAFAECAHSQFKKLEARSAKVIAGTGGSDAQERTGGPADLDGGWPGRQKGRS